MRLTLVAKDPESQPQGSPTLYRTDQGSWIVQGWIVAVPAALAQMNIPRGICLRNPRPDGTFVPGEGLRLNYEQFTGLFTQFDHEAVHLEMRDSYGTTIELPHMARWAAGEPDDLKWLRPWCDQVREHVAQGKTYRRVHVVSEPLSDYQRWSYSIVQPHIDAGTDMRWIPRRQVSSIAFPGNDFWMFDGHLVVFHHYAGNGANIDFTTSADPDDIKLCTAAFEAVWKLAIPHADYMPA